MVAQVNPAACRQAASCCFGLRTLAFFGHAFLKFQLVKIQHAFLQTAFKAHGVIVYVFNLNVGHAHIGKYTLVLAADNQAAVRRAVDIKVNLRHLHDGAQIAVHKFNVAGNILFNSVQRQLCGKHAVRRLLKRCLHMVVALPVRRQRAEDVFQFLAVNQHGITVDTAVKTRLHQRTRQASVRTDKAVQIDCFVPDGQGA